MALNDGHIARRILCTQTTRALLGLQMSFDVPAAPVEKVKVAIRRSVTAHEVYRKNYSALPRFTNLIEVMPVTLAGNGVGLAAPQIAAPLHLFVVEDTQERMGHLTPNSKRL
jgi:peptide deformylase